jgi:hypothetical protein
VTPDAADAFANAVRRALTLDRRACRSWVVERFSRTAMAAAYERVYWTAGVSSGGV